MKTFRILLADDHPLFRLGLCSLLGSHAGWEVCGQASDGREAVEKCRQMKPDLLVLDIGMPNLNGVDAARCILRDNPRQTILVLTDVTSERANELSGIVWKREFAAGLVSPTTRLS